MEFASLTCSLTRGIKANQVLSNSVSTMDIMPTSIGIIDRVMNGYPFDDEAKLYNKEELDGKDISPIILVRQTKTCMTRDCFTLLW